MPADWQTLRCFPSSNSLLPILRLKHFEDIALSLRSQYQTGRTALAESCAAEEYEQKSQA
jgi:hypothetical protein